jgi:hypothetical protein
MQKKIMASIGMKCMYKAFSAMKQQLAAGDILEQEVVSNQFFADHPILLWFFENVSSVRPKEPRKKSGEKYGS